LDKSITEQTTELIVRDFGLEVGDNPLTEEQLFDLLANAVAYMIESRLDFLLSLMYRLDIEEHAIRAALAPDAPELANIGLAKLILQRQKDRIFTKMKYKQPPLEDSDWEL
jgi:hypothetical protein